LRGPGGGALGPFFPSISSSYLEQVTVVGLPAPVRKITDL
jgi:hypothetical protein